MGAVVIIPASSGRAASAADIAIDSHRVTTHTANEVATSNVGVIETVVVAQAADTSNAPRHSVLGQGDQPSLAEEPSIALAQDAVVAVETESSAPSGTPAPAATPRLGQIGEALVIQR